MDVTDIVRSAQLNARTQGSRSVTLSHLAPEQVEALARQTLEYLRGRPGVDSDQVPGWKRIAASQAGVLPAWVDGLGMHEPERKTIRPLRTAIYDLLEERGLLFKPPGAGSSVHVSPDDSAATTDFPETPAPTPRKPSRARISVESEMGDLRAAVEAALRGRVEELCQRIASETSLDPTDYWAVTKSDKPLDVVVRLINSNAERGTFKRLSDAGRLDLTLDAALAGWTDLPLQQDLIDEAIARVDWWS